MLYQRKFFSRYFPIYLILNYYAVHASVVFGEHLVKILDYGERYFFDRNIMVYTWKISINSWS